MIEPTGFCWKCGLPCEGLFCSEKHKEQYERKQERGVMKSKREGYGITGSTR